MQLYSSLLDFCQQIAPTWRKTQQINLALLSQAIFRRRSLVLSDLARSYPVPTTRKVPTPKHGLLHRVKRLWRFVAHHSLDEKAIMQRLTRLSYTVCRSPGLHLPVLVDLTYFEPFAILSCAVPRNGRALPIAWRVFRRDLDGESELSQNHLIEAVLRQLREHVVAGIIPVIIADREFARAAFFRFLKRLPSHFVIRVDAETWVLHPDYHGPLGQLGLKPGGRRIWLPNARYGKEEREPVNLLAVWEVGQREPWFLVSNLDDPKLVERLYRKRMKIEHGFRDWKHHLRLKGTPKITRAHHFARLVTGIVALYWYICLLGFRLNRPPYRREVTCWGKLSDFKLALELVELGHAVVAPTAQRIVAWAADKLSRLRPPTPAYKLRYHRFRLPPTG